MHPVVNLLAEALTNAGWRVVSKEEPDEWWGDDRWQLESDGCAVILTFLVDPEADIHRRKKGEKVWAVMASRTLPKKWQAGAADVTLDFGKNWAGRLGAFVSALGQFRKEEPNKAPEPTPRPVTTPAEPGVAPGRVVAHL